MNLPEGMDCNEALQTPFHKGRIYYIPLRYLAETQSRTMPVNQHRSAGRSVTL